MRGRLFRAALACALLLGGVSVGRPEEAGDFAETMRASTGLEVECLEELAAWCADNKLLASRNAIAEEILALDPDHAQAHRWLKHKLGPDRKWVVRQNVVRPRDRNPEALAELPARRAAALDPYIQRLDAMLRVRADTLKPGEREQALSALVKAAPSDEGYRREHGEVLVDGVWVLDETASARTRGPEIAKGVRALVAAVKEPIIAIRTDLEGRLGVRWAASVKTPGIRVLATSGRNEAATVARLCETLPDLMRVVFYKNMRMGPGYTVYLMSSHAQGDRFAQRHPAFDAAERRRLKGMGGTWVPDQKAIAEWSRLEDKRVDASVRFLLGAFLRGGFGLSSRKAAWADEAFGIRVSWELTGTRLTYMVMPSDYGNRTEEWSTKRLSETRDWLGAALQLRREGGWPDLDGVFHRTLNKLSTKDLIVGHAIASYLLEGWPTQTPRILADIGKGVPSEKAIQAHTGLDRVALELRLVRWLEEATE